MELTQTLLDARDHGDGITDVGELLADDVIRANHGHPLLITAAFERPRAGRFKGRSIKHYDGDSTDLDSDDFGLIKPVRNRALSLLLIGSTLLRLHLGRKSSADRSFERRTSEPLPEPDGVLKTQTIAVDISPRPASPANPKNPFLSPLMEQKSPSNPFASPELGFDWEKL